MPSSNSSRTGSSHNGGLLAVGIFLFIGLIALAAWWFNRRTGGDEAEFARFMASGKTFYETRDANKSIEAFQHALALNPANPDVHLNLANAFLLGNQPIQSLVHSTEVLRFEPGSAAAHYLAGCAQLRQNYYSNAVQSLQEAKNADHTVNAVSYQLGRAQAGLGQFKAAAEQFAEVTEFDTNHPSAWYQLSQMQLRLGQRNDATRSLVEHQRIAAGKAQAADNPSIYEQCAHTDIRANFSLEQPDADGVPVTFSDGTGTAFGTRAGTLQGPIGVVDVNRRGWNDLVLQEGPGLTRLWWNSNGVFIPFGQTIRTTNSVAFTACLVGDLNTEASGGRQEDVLLLGSGGLQVLRLSTNGTLTDATRFAGMLGIPARAGALADLDFTGKLGALLVSPEGAVRTYRSLGNMAFRESTATSGIPVSITGVTQILTEDWNNDDLPDVILTRATEPPALLLNQRGGTGLIVPPQPAEWPISRAVAVADLNNDLRADLICLTSDSLTVFLGGIKDARRIPAKRNQLSQIRLIDYDNDGWLDILAWGTEGLRMWRNRGRLGFHEMTQALGLHNIQGKILHVAAADFDLDGDTDLVIELSGQGLRFLRNEGGNANHQLKIRLLGNRSNPSGIGVKLELAGGLWRALRSVQQLPTEIGTGKHAKLDAVTVRWFDTQQASADVDVDNKLAVNFFELVAPTGSCPYLYAWDGARFRFVTDILGAAPVGLPVAEGHYIEADPEEYVWIGNELSFIPRNGRYTVQLTEELREILYLDTAQLIAVDHPPDTEIHSTSKLLPGKPFLPHQLMAIRNRIPLRQAVDLSGRDVTDRLQAADSMRVSPETLRAPQLRGLAEPHGVILDFGPLDSDRPLCLALTGWLRFGGGMANIAASHNPELPFPFPVLEVETADGHWQPVAATIGAPAGKTKTILVDLTGKLPAHARRLRLQESFEIHWDRIALFAPAGAAANVHRLGPDRSDLHWRGYSEFADLPGSEPLTPLYDRTKSNPPWRITPQGWATHYGAVDELLSERDEGLAVIAGGDELTLEFDAARLPEKPSGMVREFFLWTVGWDKDADFHVAEGSRIEPLPWSSMDSQRHGREARPAFRSDTLHSRYNTRWVGPMTYARRAPAASQ
ncbi:MAG: tetratricopeptide repeat protein [Pedosphaera sp.]|nr:tetratricopeptide repeat protein [Pedosphaera sp.]